MTTRRPLYNGTHGATEISDGDLIASTILPISSSDGLTTGQEVFSRALLITGSSIAAVSGSMRLTFFTARKTETSTQVRVLSGTTAAGATPTLCRVGLFSVDSSDNGTLVASIASDTTIWAAANTSYTRSWSSSIGMVSGQRYALGQLIVTGQTLPSWAGYALMANAQSEANLVPRLTGAVGSLSDLPSSFTAAALVATLNRHYGAILP